MKRYPTSKVRETQVIWYCERASEGRPGHTAKEGPHLVRTGASRGYSRAAAPVWCCSRGIMGSSGSYRQIRLATSLLLLFAGLGWIFVICFLGHMWINADEFAIEVNYRMFLSPGVVTNCQEKK